MNYSTIDKFGRRRGDKTNNIQIMRGKPGLGFKLTPDNQFDMEGKALRNIAEPTISSDAVTKQYVDLLNYNADVRIFDIEKTMEEAATKHYVDLLNFNAELRVYELEKIYGELKNREIKLTSNGQYDMDGKSSTNIREPSTDTDAVTKQYMDRKINELQENFNYTINTELGKLHKAFNDKVDKDLAQIRLAFASIINKDLLDFLKRKIDEDIEKALRGHTDK